MISRPEHATIQQLGKLVEKSFLYHPISAELTQKAGYQHLQSEQEGLLRRFVRGNIYLYVLGDGTGESKIAASHMPFSNEQGPTITVIYNRSQEGAQKIEVLGRIPEKLRLQGLTLVKQGEQWEQAPHHFPPEEEETTLSYVRRKPDGIDSRLRVPTEEQVPTEYIDRFVDLAIRTARTAVVESKKHNLEIAKRSPGSPDYPIVIGKLGFFQTILRLEENAKNRDNLLRKPTVDFIIDGIHLRMNVKKHTITDVGYGENVRRDPNRLKAVKQRFSQLYTLYVQANGDYDVFIARAQELLSEE